jgi:Arc/MetJ family transcription regulator
MGRVAVAIDLDLELVRTIMHRYELATPVEAVDRALRALVDSEMTRADALAIGGANAIGGTPADQSSRLTAE